MDRGGEVVGGEGKWWGRGRMESDVRGRGMWCERVRRGSVREGRKKVGKREEGEEMGGEEGSGVEKEVGR